MGYCAYCEHADRHGMGDGMSNAFYLPGTKIPAETVLDGAKEAKLDTVLVVGHGPEGLYVACSDDNMADINLLADKLKARIMDYIKYDDEE